MPPIRSKCNPEEQRIDRAIQGLLKGDYPTVAIAHRTCNVPYQKLRYRFEGRKCKEGNGGHNKLLDIVQEKALLQYIDRCEELGRPCKHRHIELGANSILHTSGKTTTVSHAWTSRFIKRHNIVQHYTKSLSIERKIAQKRIDIDCHFDLFLQQYRKLNIQPANLYNFDETGFRIGCLAGQIVFTRLERQVYISDPDNREYITSMESISALGETIDPLVIIQGQVMKEKHFPIGLNEGIRLAATDSGYTNDLLTFEWLKHFDTQTRPANNEWRMLVMDGHGSHLTKEFIDYCYKPEIRISPFLLPPHSTHILQPLDIGVFQSFKHYHQELLEDSIRFGGIDYRCTDFLASFQEMRNRTFKKRVIQSAFRKSSLYLYNPQEVLVKRREFGTPERRIGGEGDEDSNEGLAFDIDYKNATTPHSPTIYTAYSAYIDWKLVAGIETGLSLSPTTARLIEKREKASKIANLSGQLAIEELYKKREAERSKTRKNGGRHIQQFGTILVGDARLRAIVRNEREEREIEAIRIRKEESIQKKKVYREGVEERKAVRLAKKAEKEAIKAARVAQIARILEDNR